MRSASRWTAHALVVEFDERDADDGRGARLGRGEWRGVSEPIRIANCSGFYGDRLSAAREMVDGGPIDVLTGDWLAELTMLILAAQTDERTAAATPARFLTQMEAGARHLRRPGHQGRQPTPAASTRPAAPSAVAEVGRRAGLRRCDRLRDGDDLMPRLDGAGRRGRGPRQPRHRRAARRRRRSADHRQRLPRAAGASSSARPRRRRGGDRPRHRRGRRVRPGGVALRLGARRLGRAGRGAWSPGTSSSAAPRPRAATTRSSTRCPGSSTPASPSPRSRPTGRSSSPSTRAPAAMVTVGTVTAQLLYEIGGPPYLEPRRDGALRHHPARAGGPGPRARQRHARRAHRRNGSRSPSTTWAASATR